MSRVEAVERPAIDRSRPHKDLREFLARADALGEILHVRGAQWDLEMGAVAEIVNHRRSNAPAVLFDEIPGYPGGYRILTGQNNSLQRLALALNFPAPDSPIGFVRAYRDRMKGFRPIPPRVVPSGSIFENVDRDDAVDLYKFPVPRVHELDGGRYIGTGDIVVMRDPDSDWINASTYRVQVHNKNTAGIWISPGKHGRQIRDKYFAARKPCPVLVSCGHDPVLAISGAFEVKYGVSEYAFAGGHRGEPIDVVLSELHKLPMPADAEIVLEGELVPGEGFTEGPFGEFTGYYASPASEQPILHVRRIYYRNDPIITMAVPMRPPTDHSYAAAIVRSGMIWDEIEAAGLAGVRGVWCHEAGFCRMFNVVSIKQAYAGHSKQAGMLAANCQSAAYLGRFVVVVDDDVDPTDLFDVVWAMCTRTDPVADIDFIRKAWATPLDPMIPHDAKSFTSNRAVIDACRPFERLQDFPPVARATPELLARVKAKFADVLETI
jgi:UbiD family decarboxylase